MIIALDLETTGLDSKKDKIIEVALICFDENTFEIIDSFSTLINPGISIPELNSNITGIFDEDVKNAPKWDEKMIQQIENFIGDAPILGHNTSFDKDFLIHAGVDLTDNIVLDTFVLGNFLAWKEKSLNLGSLCESFGIDIGSAHRAFDDTKATIEIFKYFTKQFQLLDTSKKQLLFHIFSRVHKPEVDFYIQYFRLHDLLKISQEEFIQRLLDQIGKYIPSCEKNPDFSGEEKNIKSFFEKFPNCEVRENQLKMAEKIQYALKENKKIIIEAPTGVGKTFAYSLPSILYARAFEEQVIISTHTKALQDQIFYKDLDFLQQHIGVKFSYAKLKGKKNYFSISQFLDQYFEGNFLSGEEAYLYAKIVLWLFETQFGEIDEFTLYPQEYDLIKRLHSDHFFVLQEENEYKHYEFSYKARCSAQKADIVIVNHAILLQDIKAKNPTFTNMKNLIVDEAHNLEDTTTDALKKSFQLSNIYENTQKIKSFLSQNHQIIEHFDVLSEDIYNQVAFCFDLLSDYVSKKNTYGNEVFEVGIGGDFFENQEEIFSYVEKIDQNIQHLLERTSILDEKLSLKIRSSILFFEEMIDIIKVCFDKESHKKYISIFSHNLRYGSTLTYTLLHPGKFLQTELYDKVDSFVLTSATLQIDEKMDYIREILSLGEDFEICILESDFDYHKQALLFLPNNLGSARYNNPVMFQFLQDFLSIVQGKTLILMTSFSIIKEAYLFINTSLKKLGIDILPQSIAGSKNKIINHYKKYSHKSVILGTDSFWEGVDFPGDELKYLVIHKFPFQVPTDPIFQARSKLFQDSFLQYAVSKAIIKTKQGFGRLIRTKSDTGVVILLDERVEQTQWGKKMLEAFPKNINIKKGHSDTFLSMLAKKQKK